MTAFLQKSFSVSMPGNKGHWPFEETAEKPENEEPPEGNQKDKEPE